MPVVQLYGGQKVETNPIPGVRKTAAETALSEGAGLAEAQGQRGDVIGQLGATASRFGGKLYSDVVEQERTRADQVALLNASNQLAMWENKRIYDPEQGALTVKGNQSFGLPEQVGAEYQKVASDIADTLGTDRQRQEFEKMRLERGQNLDLTLRRHVYGEMQRYEGQELQALVDNSRNAAIANATDPRRIGLELNRQVDAITTHAPRLGLGPEQVQQQIDGARSATHVGVLEQLLAQDQQKTAQIYFEETKGQINGDQIARIEKALNEGKVRGEAQKQADAIVAAGGTLTDQREKARAIDDPDVRDAVMARVEHEAAIKDRADREQEEGALKTAYNIVDQTTDVTKIPASAWVSFTGGDRSALRAYADRLSRGQAVETDIPTYYSLMQKASSDPTSFSMENLLRYRGALGDTEFKQLAGLQNSIRNHDREAADKELSGFRTHEQIVDDALTNYGIDPKSKADSAEGKAIAQLRRMLDTRVQAQGELTGKKPTNDDIQRTLDGLLSQTVKVPGSWWNIWPGGQPFFDTTKRIIDLTPADIPSTDRQQIEDALRRRNRPVSDATVLDLYLETKARTGK